MGYKILYIGLFIFIISLFLLSCLIQYDNNSTHLDHRLKSFVNKVTRSKTKISREFNDSFHRSKLYILADFYQIINKNGLKVYNTIHQISLESSSITTLPLGSIISYHISTNINNNNSSSWIFIYYPIKGWIESSHNNINNNNIFVKLALKVPTNLPKKATAICRNPQKQQYLVNTDILNSNIIGIQRNVIPTTSREECCVQCYIIDTCNMFTYTTDGLCWLKYNNSKTTQIHRDPIQPPPLPLPHIPVPVVGVGIGSKPNPNNILQQKMQQRQQAPRPAIVIISGIINSKLHLNNKPIPQHDTHDHEEGRHNYDPYVLKLQHINQQADSQHDWTNQWPIGNGLFGAMVGGGDLSSDVIPLSIAGLFTRRTPTPPGPTTTTNNNNIYVQANPQPSPLSSSVFYEARELLKQDHITNATRLMSSLQEHTPLGRFEYISDLFLIYAPNAISMTDNTGLSLRPDYVNHVKSLITSTASDNKVSVFLI